MVVLHQYEDIAVAPCHQHAVTQKFAELRDDMRKAVAALLQLFEVDMCQRSDMGIELLGDLRRDHLGKSIYDIQLSIQLHGAELDDLVEKTMSVL